jgi:hypothetical protein
VKPLSLVLLCTLLAACVAPPTKYAWGSYEDQIYVTHVKPGTMPPQAQADQFEKDRIAAQAANKPLPPGWHAQLSFVYFQLGQADLARQELLAEKQAFPESSTLVDKLLSNMARSAKDSK